MAKSVRRAPRSKLAAQNGPEPPRSRLHAGPHDVRKQFAALSAKQPLDENFRAAFVQSKIALAHTHPAIDVAARPQPPDGRWIGSASYGGPANSAEERRQQRYL